MQSPNPEHVNGLLAGLINNVPHALAFIESSGKIISWTNKAETILQLPAAAANGNHIKQLGLPTPIIDAVLKTGNEKRATFTFSLPAPASDTNNNSSIIEGEAIAIPGDTDEHGGVLVIGHESYASEPASASAAELATRFETITNVVPQIIWENDCEGKAIYFNQRFLEYSGESNAALTGPGWELIAHPEDKASAATWRAALQHKEIFESEARLRRHDGVYLWHLLRNVPLKNEDGEVRGWFGSATNIDELKTTQEQLNETSVRLRTILETATDFAIIAMDPNGFITDWNSGAENIFGYSREEAIGRHAALVFTPEDRHADIPQQEFELALRDGRALDERWHLRKDGTRFFMSGVMSPITSGTHKGFVKVARNITDRKLAEEALYLSEQQKSMVVHTAQMGEWEWELPTGKVMLSQRTCHLLGLPSTDHPFGDNVFLPLVHPDDVATVKRQMHATLNGLNIFQTECKVVRPDNGEVRWLNVYGRVIAHVDNAPKKMIGVIYDITDRKTIEKQKDDFINVASHELRTPLTGIKAYTDILDDILSQGNHPQNAELGRRLTGQVDRLTKLINDLLDSNSLSAGGMVLHPALMDIAALISEQVADMTLIARGHALVWEPVSLPLIHADRNRIGQVITNFISNAIKYSPEKTPIYIEAKDELDGVTVTVKDTGMGVSAIDQARLFERYYRSGDQQHQNYPGLGLGLFISAEIIKLHHGFIGVESVAGQGSTFYFKLPYS